MGSPDPEDMMTAVAVIAGAGTEGTVAGVLKGVLPNVAPDLVATGAGLLLFLFGDRVHKLVKAYGLGLMAGGLKGTIEKAIPPIGGGGATTKTSSSSSSSSAELAAQAYVISKGGSIGG